MLIEQSGFYPATGEAWALLTNSLAATPGFSWTFAAMVDNRPALTPSPTPSTPPPSPAPPPPSSTPAEEGNVLVIGAVIGSIVAVVVIAMLVYFCNRGRKGDKSTQGSTPAAALDVGTKPGASAVKDVQSLFLLDTGDTSGRQLLARQGTSMQMQQLKGGAGGGSCPQIAVSINHGQQQQQPLYRAAAAAKTPPLLSSASLQQQQQQQSRRQMDGVIKGESFWKNVRMGDVIASGNVMAMSSSRSAGALPSATTTVAAKLHHC